MDTVATKRHPANFFVGEVRTFSDNVKYLVSAKDPDLRRVRITRLEPSQLSAAYIDFFQRVSELHFADQFLKSHLTVVADMIQKGFSQAKLDWQYVEKESLWIDYTCCLLNTADIDYSRLDQSV